MKNRIGTIYCKNCEHLKPTGYDYGNPQQKCWHPSNILRKQKRTDSIEGPGEKYEVEDLTPHQKNHHCNCKDFTEKYDQPTFNFEEDGQIYAVYYTSKMIPANVFTKEDITVVPVDYKHPNSAIVGFDRPSKIYGGKHIIRLIKEVLSENIN